jgi:penicillin-insensitive murein endopeptidase
VSVRPARLSAIALSGVLAAPALAVPGCAAAPWSDFTSVSVGSAGDGRMRRPVAMPLRGPGFRVPTTWRERGNRWGTRELVGAVERAAATVRGRDRRVTLGVADLSPRRGGKTPWHKSHQSGRDVDLILYSVDARGRPLPPPGYQMVHYDARGRAFQPVSMAEPYVEPGWEARRFDPRRNWLLVEALLADPGIRVQWIFVAAHLEAQMSAWARAHERPVWAIEYARTVMREPVRAEPHDDHMHVRIYCPRTDRPYGCVDTGPVWAHEKKTMKYDGPERYDPVLWRTVLAMPLFFPRL